MRRKTILTLIIALTSLSGCLETQSGHVAFDFNIWFEGIKDGEYIYTPAIVNSSNNPIINIDEYYFIQGNGKVEYIQINNTVFLNISAYSNNIEIKVERKNEPQNKSDLHFSGTYFNLSGYGEKNYNFVYYSGNGNIYSYARFLNYEQSSSIGLEYGPIYINHGWNDIRIDSTGEIWDL